MGTVAIHRDSGTTMKLRLMTAVCLALSGASVRAADEPSVVPLPPMETLAACQPQAGSLETVVCGDACCPQWPQYFVFDVLFLQRDNAAGNRPLAEGSTASPDPGATLLDTADLQFAVAPGLRLLWGQRVDDEYGWEVGYLGVYGMWADAGVQGVNQVAVPGAIADSVPGWLTADSVRPTYASSLNIVEANVFHGRCCEGCSPNGCGRYCRCTDILCGAFWAGLEESANLNVTCCAGDPPSPYRVQSSSNLIGGQIGIRRRRDWDRWALEGTAKAGVAGVVLSQSSGAITSSLAPGQVYRDPTSASTGGVGLLSVINATAVYRLTDHWGLRAGYNLIWLDGLALAPDQWDFTDTADSGRSVVGGGSLFLHGANLGVERRW